MGKDLSILRGILDTKPREKTEEVKDIPKGGAIEAKVTKSRTGAVIEAVEEKKAAAEGCYEGETRYTTILAEDTLDRLRRLSYWDRRSIKDIISTALVKHIDEYEKKNGTLKPRPPKKNVNKTS